MRRWLPKPRSTRVRRGRTGFVSFLRSEHVKADWYPKIKDAAVDGDVAGSTFERSIALSVSDLIAACEAAKEFAFSTGSTLTRATAETEDGTTFQSRSADEQCG